MTLDADLSAVRAVARQLRTSTRPIETRRAGALAASLDHSARGIARGMDFLREEASGRKHAVELGDPDPYRGLSVEDAAAVLAERTLAIVGWSWDDSAPSHAERQRRIAAEVNGFTAAVVAGGRRTSPLARGVAADRPDANGAGKARTDGRATSKAAALAAEPKSGSRRRQVLDAVLAVARDPRTVGLTDVEIQRATGISPNSARPRRVELVDGGWLADSGRTREHFGREHTVCVVTDKAAGLLRGLPVPA